MLEMVGDFIDQGKQNLRMLQEHLAQFKDIYQYVYSHVFPEMYTTSEKRGFDLKSNFHILFKAYHDKMMLRQQQQQQQQQQQIAKKEQQETSEFEQKPIKILINLAIAKSVR